MNMVLTIAYNRHQLLKLLLGNHNFHPHHAVFVALRLNATIAPLGHGFLQIGLHTLLIPGSWRSPTISLTGSPVADELQIYVCCRMMTICPGDLYRGVT